MTENIDLQKRYDALLDLVKCGKDEHLFLQEYTIEELEQLACLGWEDDASEKLFKILMHLRKQKMNEQFIFNRRNILAILHIDEQLKICCRQLKEDAENEFFRLLERKEKNKSSFFFFINAYIDIFTGSSLLDSSLDVNGKLLSIYLGTREKDRPENMSRLPIFDFAANYADCIGNNCNNLTDNHIGFAFYKLYKESYLSLQDIIEIITIYGKIEPHYNLQHDVIKNS